MDEVRIGRANGIRIQLLRPYGFASVNQIRQNGSRGLEEKRTCEVRERMLIAAVVGP